MENFGNYITHNFGIPVIAKSLHSRELNQLPLYLKGNFDFFRGQMEGRELLWAKVLDEGKATPDGLQNQKIQLRKWFPMPVVFVFDHLDAWQRKRFIEKKVGFVQTRKQVYIPEMMLQLSDVRNQDIQYQAKKGNLSFPTQCAILYHLQNSSLDDMPWQKIAEILQYSKMTVTRIARELQNSGLITVQGGKEKHFKFNQQGVDLWARTYPLLRTPVKEVWYSHEDPRVKDLLEAGETALGHYTMLSEGGIECYVMGKEQFRSLRVSGKLPELNKKYGDFRIEVWHYDPKLVAGQGSKSVDKLSLYLSMPDAEDERVKAALDHLLSSMKW